jgi:pimeloyl-ACP methyl ester carboxylesterase
VSADVIAPPSRLSLALEGLGFLDLIALLPAFPLLMTAPRRVPQSVLVLPGLGADDRSTAPMRGYLSALGYDVYGWGLDRRHRHAEFDLGAIKDQLKRLTDKSGHPVSLIGWSRGGMLAREAARRDPDHVSLVVTMGSPFASPGSSNASWLWQIMTREELPRLPPEQLQRLAAPIPVPATAIYTRGDGVVAWRACLEQATPQTENIEVRSTHLGLGFHAPALWVIADRLAQPFGSWRPFRPSAFLSPFFPRTGR